MTPSDAATFLNRWHLQNLLRKDLETVARSAAWARGKDAVKEHRKQEREGTDWVSKSVGRRGPPKRK